MGIEEPYTSTVKVIKSVDQAKTLPSFKALIKYAWNKIGLEASRYWQDEMSAEKLVVSEDARLMIVAYVLAQARCDRVFALLVALQDFVNDQIYEECAPLATFESAIRVLEYEYRERAEDVVEFNLDAHDDHKDELLRFSHTKDMLEGSFLFAKMYSDEEHAETRQTYMQVHRQEMNHLKERENFRMTTMQDDDYLDVN